MMMLMIAVHTAGVIACAIYKVWHDQNLPIAVAIIQASSDMVSPKYRRTHIYNQREINIKIRLTYPNHCQTTEYSLQSINNFCPSCLPCVCFHFRPLPNGRQSFPTSTNLVFQSPWDWDLKKPSKGRCERLKSHNGNITRMTYLSKSLTNRTKIPYMRNCHLTCNTFMSVISRQCFQTSCV